VPPTPPLSDKADLYGNLVAAQLQEINPQVMDDIMLQVMQLLIMLRKKILIKSPPFISSTD